jgi:3-hydroxy-D-aspartate aldolase
VSEAEALVRGGISDILVSNQVTGALKVKRLARLARSARIIVCVDDAANIEALSAAAQSAGSTIEVLVDIDCGARRCGVRPGVPAVELARSIAVSPNLTFSGLQAYHGSAQHIIDLVERRAAIASAVDMTRDTVGLLKEQGLECAIVGGAGTGSFDMEGSSGVYNELQCGSYIFMDADYGRVRGDNGMVGGFEHALFVLATVMSAPPRDGSGLSATVRDVAYLGASRRVVLNSAGGVILHAELPETAVFDAEAVVGQNVRVSFDPGDLIVFEEWHVDGAT